MLKRTLGSTVLAVAFVSISMACGGVVAEQTDAGPDGGKLVSTDAAPEASGVSPEAGADSGSIADSGSVVDSGPGTGAPMPAYCPQNQNSKYGGEYMNAIASGHYTTCPTGNCPAGDCCANFGPPPPPWVCVPR